MSHFHEQVLDIRSVVLRQSLMTLSEWNPCLLIRQTSDPFAPLARFPASNLAGTPTPEINPDASGSQPLDISPEQTLSKTCLGILDDLQKGSITPTSATLKLTSLLSGKASESALIRFIEQILDINRERFIAEQRGIQIHPPIYHSTNSEGADKGDQNAYVEGTNTQPTISSAKRSKEDIVDEDGVTRSKKQADDSCYAWKQAYVPFVTPNYMLDSKGAKSDILSQPFCPDFPDGLWSDVLLNRYIDFDKVYLGYYTLIPNYKQSHTIGDFKIVLHSGAGNSNRGSSKTIKTHGEWAIAFTAVKSDEFEDYERFIIGQFTALQDAMLHQHILNLNRAIRLRVSRSNRLFYNSYDKFNDLVSQHILTPAAAELSNPPPAKCTKCFNTNTPICIRWNRGLYTIKGCRYWHICLKCGSRHQEKDCVTKPDFDGARVAQRNSTPSATFSETAPPLPFVPHSELVPSPANDTIQSHPDLFKIVTPINVDHFESLLSSHPNPALVHSVCHGLRHGFWPFANIDPDAPTTFDYSKRAVDDAGSTFL
ncbi:hypothetical protein K439DRAFT_1612418 [Ramaria rubella]|nr:hypothetical protein K439DRAFT_1612418 [Ramaria rubella]